MWQISTDRRQTVQLPAGFELGANQIWVRKDGATGEVILTPMRPDPNRHGLDALFRRLDEPPLPDWRSQLWDGADRNRLPGQPLKLLLPDSAP